jgi:hypothetical protein
MTTEMLLGIIAVLAVVVVGLAAWIYMQKRRSRQLRTSFGPEYDRALHNHGNRASAEAELAARKARVEKLRIVPLPAADAHQYAEHWRAVQAQFVDDPVGAVREADHLVCEVMERRGYPMGDFETRAADISVDHPRVVENYRSAHEIALRNERGTASTEDLRRALVHYRSLFDELIQTPQPEPVEVRR